MSSFVTTNLDGGDVLASLLIRVWFEDRIVPCRDTKAGGCLAFLFVAAVGWVGVDGTCEGVAPDGVDEDLLFFHLILPTDFFAFFGIVSSPSWLVIQWRRAGVSSVANDKNELLECACLRV